MTAVVDTSAWIAWATDGPGAEKLALLLPPRETCVVPTLVQFELAKWFRREQGEDAAIRMIAYTMKCEVVALDTKIALIAAQLGSEHRLASADAIIYATAASVGADLITCDAHFETLPGVTYVDTRRPA